MFFFSVWKGFPFILRVSPLVCLHVPNFVPVFPSVSQFSMVFLLWVVFPVSIIFLHVHESFMMFIGFVGSNPAVALLLLVLLRRDGCKKIGREAAPQGLGTI